MDLSHFQNKWLILYVSSEENRNNNEALDDDTGGFEEDYVCIPKKRRVTEPRFISKICVPDVVTPRRVKRVIALEKRNERKERKKINTLHCQKRDLLKRITCLQDMILLCLQ
ncbi:PREDICTED: uncharacterized protein LOC106742661 isoform X2 [Dinoponera quadriceps]|uniref:Uncharacterized protein LOC106742661 isoform X2 n=1 Tax=Dinoponera quadriceps TaxID=609295 RepID=A0A6P3WZ24_DINQU|nr:PREDICTED: uncharacterized protein LOC106742661 isoform X2 [Dinoponera quadriceps]